MCPSLWVCCKLEKSWNSCLLDNQKVQSVNLISESNDNQGRRANWWPARFWQDIPGPPTHGLLPEILVSWYGPLIRVSSNFNQMWKPNSGVITISPFDYTLHVHPKELYSLYPNGQETVTSLKSLQWRFFKTMVHWKWIISQSKVQFTRRTDVELLCPFSLLRSYCFKYYDHNFDTL